MQIVAVKPIARWQIWLGKWLGLMSLNAALLAISGAAKIGMTELLRRAYAVIQETRAKEAEQKSSTIEAAQ